MTSRALRHLRSDRELRGIGMIPVHSITLIDCSKMALRAPFITGIGLCVQRDAAGYALVKRPSVGDIVREINNRFQ